jgi:galactokinase/mevalonate kinase-like predicted kinase
MDETKDAAEKTDEAYRQKQRADLKELTARLQLLEAKAEKASADVKMSYNQELRNLREKQKEASEKIEQLREATGEAWQEVKKGTEEAMADLKASLDNAASRLK